MKAFLKKAGVKTEKEFYSKFPSEDHFFEAHPDMLYMKDGGIAPINSMGLRMKGASIPNTLMTKAQSSGSSNYDLSRAPAFGTPSYKKLQKEQIGVYKNIPEFMEPGSEVMYGKYNDKGVVGKENPNVLEQTLNNVDYFKNNNQESNIYRLENTHYSVEDRNVNKDFAKNGSVIKGKKKFQDGGFPNKSKGLFDQLTDINGQPIVNQPTNPFSYVENKIQFNNPIQDTAPYDPEYEMEQIQADNMARYKSNPNLEMAALGTGKGIDMSGYNPNKNYTGNDFQGKGKDKKKSKWGDYLAPAIAGIDALIPQQRPELQNINTNSNYNPNAYGTGSQAIMKNGGIMPIGNDSLQIHSGGNAPQISENPFDGGTGMFTGKSHEDGGVKGMFGSSQFEAEGNEPYRIDGNGDLEIFGNLNNPLTGNKFKKDAANIALNEKKVNKYLDKGSFIMKDMGKPKDVFDKMKINSAQAMIEGGLKKQQQLAESKEHLSLLQKLTQQDEANKKMAKNGGMFKYKDGGIIKAQAGATINAGNNTIKYKEMAKEAAKKYGVRYEIVERIIDQESGFNPLVKNSNAGAKGIMQFMPKTAKIYGVENILNSSKDEDVQRVIEAGVKHLSSTIAENNGDEILGVAAYNMGQGNLNDFIKASGKNKKDYTGDDLRKRFKVKQVESPSNKRSLAQNQTDEYLNNVFGNSPTPEKFRKEFYEGDPEVVSTKSFDANFNKIINKYKPAPEKPYVPPAAVPPQDFTFREPQSNFQPYQDDLNLSQIAPEMISLATNRQRPVALQSYTPDLYSPYEVTFQDRRNQVQGQMASQQKNLAYDPTSQAMLAGQAYEANNNINAEEFRTNQGIYNDVLNKNVSLINDAKLKNISLADTQYVRQEQARSNTQDRTFGAAQSIASKIAQHNLENRQMAITQNAYRDFSYNENGELKYVGAKPEDIIGFTGSSNKNYVPSGFLTGTNVTTQKGGAKVRETFENITPVSPMGGRRNPFIRKNGGVITQSSIAKLMNS